MPPPDPTEVLADTKPQSRDFIASASDPSVMQIVNAPHDDEITAYMLAERLRAGDPQPWPEHLATFFCECESRQLFYFCTFHEIPKKRLAQAYAATKAFTNQSSAEVERALSVLFPDGQF